MEESEQEMAENEKVSLRLLLLMTLFWYVLLFQVTLRLKRSDAGFRITVIIVLPLWHQPHLGILFGYVIFQTSPFQRTPTRNIAAAHVSSGTCNIDLNKSTHPNQVYLSRTLCILSNDSIITFQLLKKLEELRNCLHASDTPKIMQCREEEYSKIKQFILTAVAKVGSYVININHEIKSQCLGREEPNHVH